MKYQASEVLAQATFEFYSAIKEVNNFDDERKFLDDDRYLHPEIMVLHSNFDKFVAVANKYVFYDGNQ
jgi:hypothetical protein